MNNKINEALQILKDFKMPRAQLNDRTALCLLALIDLKPDNNFSSVGRPLIGITPIMDFVKKYYGAGPKKLDNVISSESVSKERS